MKKKFKFIKKRGVKADDKEVASIPTKKEAPVKEAAPKVVAEEKPVAKKVKKEEPVKTSKLDGLSPKEKAKVPFNQLDPKDPVDNKEIIRRRNMGLN